MTIQNMANVALNTVGASLVIENGEQKVIV